ncbi:hypothetical protein OKW18_003831 [Streptomyces pratensis]|nr:hypothetical protein [Streptomyces pratensis]
MAEEGEGLPDPVGQLGGHGVGQVRQTLDAGLVEPLLATRVLHGEHLDAGREECRERVEVGGVAAGVREAEEPQRTGVGGVEAAQPRRVGQVRAHRARAVIGTRL